MKNNKTAPSAMSSLVLLCGLASPVLASSTTAEFTENRYFKIDVGAVRFDLPGYKDGFGVVGLAPVSGPHFTKGEKQTGESLTLTGGVVTQYPIDLMDGLLFVEGSAFYSHNNDSHSALLGSDSAGNNIRFGLFNGSDGFNSNTANPLHFRLKSELDYFGGDLAIGVQAKAANWTLRYQVGPQFIGLKQRYKLYGTSPSNASRYYNRDESLDTDYLGMRLAASANRALTEKLHIEARAGLSILTMDADYEGTDDPVSGSASSLSRSLNETTYGADLKLALRYAFSSQLEVGLSYGLSYLDKVPEIVHATGATGNGTFVPARLDTSHMLVQQAGIELKKMF